MSYQHPSRKAKVRLWLGAAICVVILVVGGIVMARNHYYDSLKPVSSSQRTITVTIPSGSSLEQVAVLLEEAKVIRKAWSFKQFVLGKDLENAIQAGTYAIKPSQSVAEIVNIITEGKVASNLVTIKPAQRIDQIEQSLINSGFAPADVAEALNPRNYADHPALVDKPADASLEGYLYPESFLRTAETTPSQIIRFSLDEMQKRLTPDIRASFANQGLSVYRAVILASIVEREVPAGGERAQVAQVFLKRLNMGMKLESDATASYGAILAGDEPSLTYDSAYNTYRAGGLPPGPISNVSESSLAAVANPANTDWVYFVSGDDGVTHFSKTLAEHEALTAKYCTKLCQ